MLTTSILLPIDGSLESRIAAEFSWALAKRYNAHVFAQHVLDLPAMWEFLAHDKFGFTGTGPYLLAFEKVREQMYALGQTLLQAYETASQSQGIDPDTILEEGSTVATICARATSHDLVIVGHKPRVLELTSARKRPFTRHSLVERLSHHCPRPLIVVQDKCELWNSLTLIISGASPYSASLSGCAEFADKYALPLRVCYWLPDDDEEFQRNRIARLVEGLRKVYPNLSLTLEVAQGPRGWWLPNIELERGTLVSVPLLSKPDTCETPFGTPSETIVRHCQLPYFMLWPETTKDLNSADPTVPITLNG